MQRTCKKCGITKPLTDYSPAKKAAQGRRRECRACMAAYQQVRSDARRGGPPKPPRQPSIDGTTCCTKCGQIKQVSEFRPDLRNRDGVRSNCRDCDRAYARTRQRETEQSKVWARANPEQYARITHRSALRRKYGIQTEQYDAMLADQGGRCAICRSADTGSATRRYFSVDHDHVTGAVRGLLCISCNTGIGGLRDDPRLVIAALRYLINPPAQRYPR